MQFVHGHRLDQQTADREHGLSVAQHALEAQKAAHEAAIDVHEALHPPPAAKKRARGGAVVADTVSGLAGDGSYLPYEEPGVERLAAAVTTMFDNFTRQLGMQQSLIADMAQAITAPKRIMRDEKGNVTGTETILPTPVDPLNVTIDGREYQPSEMARSVSAGRRLLRDEKGDVIGAETVSTPEPDAPIKIIVEGN
jgi:hypothetical protein